jgi:late competence protein required for DNA uptake (superfamily II DNA/RNA helicase)
MSNLTTRQHRLVMVLTKHNLYKHVKDLDLLLKDIVGAMLPAKGDNAQQLKGNQLRNAQETAHKKLVRKHLF